MFPLSLFINIDFLRNLFTKSEYEQKFYSSQLLNEDKSFIGFEVR